MNEAENPQGLQVRAYQLACMVERANPEDTRWLDALKQGAENVRAALEEKPLAVVKGWINKDDPFHLQEDLKLTPHVPHQLHISGLKGDRAIAFATRVQMNTFVIVTITEGHRDA